MLQPICLVLLTFVTTPVLSQSKNELRELEKQISNQILDENIYDRRISPVNNDGNGTTGAVVVTNLYLRQIEYVCTKNQEWKIQMTFRQQWTDPRLRYDQINRKLKYMNLQDSDRVWVPDTFISNSRSESKMNTLVRVYPDGKILLSYRLTTTLVCPMDLKDYPFDSQTCSITIASYGYTTEDILYFWKENEPIQLSKDINLPDFVLTKSNTSYCTSKTNTGEYSCVKVGFNLKREPSQYVYKWLVPTAFLTFLSFASFWIKPKNTTRVKLLCITLILLYLNIIYINEKASPAVSYSTAKDCWLSTCLLFILGAFVEYGIVTIVDKLNKPKNEETKGNQSPRTDPEGDIVAQKLLAEEKRPDVIYKQCTIKTPKELFEEWRGLSISHGLDMLSFILFPLLFSVYIITFFISKTQQ